MTRGEIELIADTLLIQKIVMIDYGIQKSAGYAEELRGMLGEGLSAVRDGVKGTVDTSTIGSAVESVGNMLATGALFKLWWPLGIINAVASTVFGVNVITIAKKIWSMLKGPLETNGQVAPSDVTDATMAVTSELTASASMEDPFMILRQADEQGKLFHLIKSGASRSGLFGWMSGLNRRVGRSLIGGFIGWAIKAALLGAGLLAVSGAAASLLGFKKKKEVPVATDHPAAPVGATYQAEPEQDSSPNELTPTGQGQGKHNQGDAKWLVPTNGSIPNMLLNWAAYVYQEFQDQSKWSLISSTPSFNKTVNTLRQAEEFGSNQLTMPKGYESVKQVVDQFAGEASAKIKGNN